MKILALECSATAVSAAIEIDGKIVANEISHQKITHSQTLLPLAKKLLDEVNLTPSDIDTFAISSGPGSFTGVRIGISAVKGLAAANNTPCKSVSTLLSMAYNYIDTDCVVCAVMDARCNQVYNALFEISGGKVTRICEDRALLIPELIDELNKCYTDKKVVIVGDGTHLFEGNVPTNVLLSEQGKRYQNAASVILAAREISAVTPEKLLPTYLRLPQAERELKLKKERGN